MTEAADPGSGMLPAKRPAPDSNASAAKRQDIGIGKNAKDNRHITSRLGGGAYRLVTQLQKSYTGSIEQDRWPAIILDEDMQSKLLAGKFKPQTAKEAFDYPGAFTGTFKPSERDKIVPVQLLFNDAGALYVPSKLLSVMQWSSVEQLAEDKSIPDALRQAYAAIRDGHDIEYWRERLAGAQKDADGHDESSDGEAQSDHHDNEELAVAALERLNRSEPPRGAPTTHVPADRAKSVDAAMPSEDITMTEDADVQKQDGERLLESKPPIEDEMSNAHHESSAENESSKRHAGLGSKAATSEDTAMSGVQPTAIGEVPAVKSEPGQAEPSGSMKAKDVKIETKHHLELSKDERSELRRRKALRKAKSDEVRFTVGHRNEEFIVKKARLEESKYFKDKIEYDPEDDEYHLATHKFNRFDPDDFEPVAEFLSTGDYYPQVIETEQDEVLKDFDKTDSSLSGKLVIQSINLCKIATQFEMDNLRKAAIRKFKLLAPYTPSNFQQFFGVMYDQDFCNDEELKQWVFDYAAKHFFDLLDTEGKFKTFLQNQPVIAKKIFRLLAGLPAEEVVAAPKKRGPARKRAGSNKEDDKAKPATPKKKPGPKPATASKATATSAPKATSTKPSQAKNVEASTSKSATTSEIPATKAPAVKTNTKAAAAKKQGSIEEESDESSSENEGDEIAGVPPLPQQAKEPASPKPRSRPPKSKPAPTPKSKPGASKAASKTVTPHPAPSDAGVPDSDGSDAEATPPKPRKTATAKKQPASKPATTTEPITMTQTLFANKKKDVAPPEKSSPAETKPKQVRKKATPTPKTPRTRKTPAMPTLADRPSEASGKHHEVAVPSPVGLGDEIPDD